MCDITISSDDARFGEVEVLHGWGPPILITPFVMGLKAAKEFMLTGAMVNPQDALRLGLINRIVEGDKLEAEAEKLGRQIAAVPRAAVRHNKHLINQVYETLGQRAAFDLKTQPS